MKRILKKLLRVAQILGLLLASTLGLNAQTGTIQIGSGTTATSYTDVTTPIHYYDYMYRKFHIKLWRLGCMDRTHLQNIIYFQYRMEPISDMTQVFSGNIHTCFVSPRCC